MIDWLAKAWHALRERFARKHAEIAWRCAQVTRERAKESDQLSPRAETARMLQSWLDCAREDVRREQAELIREREEVTRLHAEIARERAEVARERAETDRLRAEIDALRLDNRALLNSLLGTAGIPPLEVPRTGADAPPVRRPSWPQIAAKREISAARKAEAIRKQQQVDSQP